MTGGTEAASGLADPPDAADALAGFPQAGHVAGLEALLHGRGVEVRPIPAEVPTTEPPPS